MQRATNGKIALAYDVEGSGPDLLLVAGSASTRPLWGLVRPQLAQSFRTIAFDNRDSGDSTIANDSYTLHDLAQDAAAVLDAAGAKRAHVVGHSMGGAIAQELALSHPDRVASLTLVCTWARCDGYAKNLMELMRSLTEYVDDERALLATILFMGSGITTLREASLWEMTDAAMALGPLAPREALIRQWQLDLSVDTLAQLPSLRVPAHVIWGSEDRLLPPPLSQELLAAIPGAVGTRIDACGHVPMVAAPDAFVEAVTRFLAAL
jgi:pimeloyl-ACP methyl ester carboxylesterase